jgi:hypothetical protein
MALLTLKAEEFQKQQQRFLSDVVSGIMHFTKHSMLWC